MIKIEKDFLIDLLYLEHSAKIKKKLQSGPFRRGINQANVDMVLKLIADVKNGLEVVHRPDYKRGIS